MVGADETTELWRPPAYELFSRGKWMLVSAQVLSCCVYEIPKQQFMISFTLGQIQAFNSFLKELHSAVN